MLEELFTAICEKAVKADSPAVVAVDGLPSNSLLLREGGALRFVTKPSAPRSNKPLSIETIATLADRFYADEAGAEVWYSRNAVTAILNSQNRWDRATFKLELSEQMGQLEAFGKMRNQIDQPSLVLLLRTTFHGCTPMCEEFLGIIRNLSFKSDEEGNANIQHGKTSLGRAVRSEVYGTAAIPEYVTFTIPVFGNVQQDPVNVACAIDVYPTTKTFRIIPLPRQIETAIREGEAMIEASIRAALENKDVDVYYGEP